MTHGYIVYIVRYSEGNQTASTGQKNLDEMIDTLSSVKNGNNFLLFEWKDQSEEDNSIIEPVMSNIEEHLVNGLDGTKKSIISYLNKIRDNKNSRAGR